MAALRVEEREKISRGIAVGSLRQIAQGPRTGAINRRESLSLGEKLRMLEPFVPSFNLAVAGLMELNRRDQAAIPILEALPRDAAGGGGRNIMLAHAEAGRYVEAADALLLIPENQKSRRVVEDAAISPENLPTLEGALVFVFGYVGAADRAIERYERLHEIQDSNTATMWFAELAPMRKTGRFKTLMHNVGLVAYWRARGWPDLCRPVGADDFACD